MKRKKAWYMYTQTCQHLNVGEAPPIAMSQHLMPTTLELAMLRSCESRQSQKEYYEHRITAIIYSKAKLYAPYVRMLIAYWGFSCGS